MASRSNNRPRAHPQYPVSPYGVSNLALLQQPRRPASIDHQRDVEQARDYVYVGDVARANFVALEGEAPSGA